MFKIESILTPLLLSYVDKYVKNVAPKDSQVSLWEGEAIFNKLDLRLDVLEQELQLPFTFVNGHVHELRINVPWTKLGSEPIIVTVNTFECIMKLKDGNEAEDESADDSTPKKKPQRLDVEGAPPSFVQSLISRILMNMNIICNNVILKYVEGDIVMSINVKSAQLHTADGNWEKAYIDTAQTDMVIRKLISLIDVTICLDQRDASGKIETYQDPLLYRSMIEGRAYIAYDNSTTRSPTVSRFDFKSDEMELSVTDQQLPMLLRLAQLCAALYFGDLVLNPPKVSTDAERDVEKSLSEGNEEEESWGRWAWSLVPSINTIWEDDVENDDEKLDKQSSSAVFHFAAHLHKALITIKVSETDVKSEKITFRPIACANFEGLFLDCAVRHPDWANIQMGVSAGQVVAVDSCLCKGPFMQYENQPVLASAGQLGKNETKYLDQSLFNELAPENQTQRRDYNYEWEDHFQNLTEEKMLERSQCCSVDYFYHLTLSEDEFEADPNQSYLDLEDSNLKERLMVRCIVGPGLLNVNGDSIHRLEKIVHSLFSREFEPYSNSVDVIPQHLKKHVIPTMEDVEKMQEFIPLKCYCLTVIQPTLCIFPTHHPSYDVTAVNVCRKHPKKKKFSEENTSLQVEPAIIVEASRIEVQQIVPMYPKRVVQVAINLSPLSDHFLYHSQSHLTGKLFGAEINLANMSQQDLGDKVNIVPPFSCIGYLKELQYPDIWKNPYQSQIDFLLEVECFCIQLTWPQVLLMSSILNSWFEPGVEKTKFMSTNLLESAVSISNEYSALEFSMDNWQCKYIKNDTVHCASAHVGNCYVKLKYWVNETCHIVTLFHGPEMKENIHQVNFFNENYSAESLEVVNECMKTVIQFPINSEICSAPALFVMTIKGLSFYFDPVLYDWIDYFPNIVHLESTISTESARKDEAAEGSALSSTIPTESQSLLKSEEEKFSISKEVVQYCLQLFSTFKRILIEVQCETISLVFPTISVPMVSDVSHVTYKAWTMFSQNVLPNTLVVNLPRIMLHSGTQRPNLSSSIDDVLIYTVEGYNISQDLFPWTLTLTNFSAYTLHTNKELLYCINPLSLSATIALNSELVSDKLSKINLCIHADNDLVCIQLSDKQVGILANISQVLLDAMSKLFLRAQSTFKLFALSGNKDGGNVSMDTEMAGNKFEFTNILAELPKLTLWVQWTLPKLTINLILSDAYRLNLEFDELGLSLDVQEVYSKIKFTLTAFNWNHYQKDDFTNQYTPGPFAGIFFTCSDKLSKNINILNPKNELLDESTDTSCESDSMHKSKSSYNFLSVNFTRALSKNVQHRWSQLLRDHNDAFESKVVDPDSCFDRYVSEIDVKIRSFDCVLWFPVLTTTFRIFEPIFQLRFSFLSSSSIQFSSKLATEPEGYQLKWINNNNLPLVYLNVNTVRIFIPKTSRETEGNHDVLIYQMKKLTISSQVENPLSRIILRSDILALAQHARIFNVPGSNVEDRQYQLDVVGISLSTGSWKELIKRSRVSEAPSIGSQLCTMGENPALEWNNKHLKSSDIESELMCLPLVCNFNIRIVAAPAIVYEQLEEDILVAGHSLEFNITSDLDLFLSFMQLSLIYQICYENIFNIFEIFKGPLKHIEKQKSRISLQTGASSEPDSGIEIRLDSATDSELSVLPTQYNALKSIIPAKVIIEQQTTTNKWLNHRLNFDPVLLVPFEILFTARGFAFAAYTDKLKQNTSLINVKKESKTKKKCQKRESDRSDGYEGSDEAAKEDETDVIIPIIYVALSQPHAFLQCRHTESKLDISCFDFVLKGSSDKLFIPASATKILPSLEDFNVFWIETKPGDVNSRTGIPPALVTISIKNILSSQAAIEISVDRPWKLNLSISKYEQILNYIETLKDVTVKSTSAPIFQTVQQLQLTKDNIDDPLSSLSMQAVVEKLRYLASFIQIISFKTVQVVTVFETVAHKQNAQILFAWDLMSSNTCLKEGKNNLVDEISLRLCVTNLSIKLSYNRKLRSLLQPCCTNINYDLIWDSWNKCSAVPRLYINVELEAMFLLFGRESWLCLHKLHSHIDEFLKNYYKALNTTTVEKNEKSKSQLEKYEQTWHDDLRGGRFQYIQDTDDIGLQPAPNEIVFCKEQVGQPASMAWCYPEPRVLTRVEIYPIPFRTTGSSGQNDQVNCVLQYWDGLLRSYVKCRAFRLSESQHCHLNLPQVLPNDSKQELFISHQWRVILDYYDPDNEIEEPTIRKSLVSPLALAACMRVDSYFNPTLIPTIQSRLAVDVIQFSLTNHLSSCKDTPLALNPFSFDNAMPLDQDFFVINLQNSNLIARSWKNWHKLEAKTTLSCDILEYRALTLRTFVEPCSLRIESVYTPKQKPAIIDGIVRGDSLFIYLGQSAMHTLYFASSIFLQKSESITERLLLTHYVICNDTQETIRFGQVDTDENIVLHSRQMHAYSWRSHRNKQLLHVCVDGMQWKWCDVFGIDKLGVETRTMEQKGKKVTLIIKVKRYNKGQKQVIICGQLIFANRLDQNLEIKLFPVFNTCAADMEMGREKSFSLGSKLTAASCLYEPGTRRGFQICLSGEHWSGEIHFPIKSLVTDMCLINVPVKKNEFLNFLCHFFTEQIGSSCQILVLFAPLYIVETHLPCQINLLLSTPETNENQTYQVDGSGQEFQLHCSGSANSTHQVSFRLGPESESSHPSVLISTKMISQVTKLPHPKTINIEAMTSNWMSNHFLLWPYDDDDLEKKLHKLSSGIVDSVLKSRKIVSNKDNLPKILPNIDLEVSMTQRWPGCNTLLIQVKPWGLIINKSTIDLLITIDGVDWTIEHEQVFASPNIKEFIKLGIIDDCDTHYSDPLHIMSDDWSLRRYWPNVLNSVPLNGVVKCNIKVKKGDELMICCLTLSTKVWNGIRLFQIQPAFNIVNKTEENFQMATFSTPTMEHKFDFQPQCAIHSQLKPKSGLKRNVLQPLLFWDTLDPEDLFDQSSEECIKYISFCLSNETSNPTCWSLPCRVITNSLNSRNCFAVPISVQATQTQCGIPLPAKPFVLTVHEVEKINYLVVRKDKHAQFLIHNHCQIPIYCGQNIPHSPSGFQVAEEAELVNCLPVIAAMTANYYTFPQTSKRFPDMCDVESTPKLHLASASFDTKDVEDEEECLIWSRGIDVTTESDLFLNIPNYGDVKIHLERIAHTMYIYIDPVSRVEVSAKEIRGRIESADHMKVTLLTPKIPVKKRSVIEKKDKKANQRAVPELATSLKPMDVVHPQRDLFIYEQAYLKQVCFVLLNDSFANFNVTEVIRCTAENIMAVLRPRVETCSSTKRIRCRIKDDVFIYVGRVQVDNQMFNEGKFDYPVISIPQNECIEQIDDGMPMEILLQKLKWHAFLRIECTLEKNYLENILVAVKPLSAYVEDLFLFKLYSLIWKLAVNPALYGKYKNLMPRKNKLPLRAVIMSGVYSLPFQCASMIIEPLDVKISVRSSVKLDVSLVEVPLSFARFERQFVTTSFDRIGNAVAMHFLTGALFKAGWVVGSVDLLGNPGGFARSVGSGVADFVSFPYNGFFSGPWAFFSGLTYGTSSLLRQFSSGSLHSVTSWANSVSRNMERMSLDAEYHLQNEEYRRHKPDSLIEGLTQGLSGFGISILAAIAGIVDQPMQAIQNAIDQHAPSAAVTGLVSGVGKGLVGIVAKPIAGAAELIAQAGHGILYGTGWSKVLIQKFEPVINLVENSCNSKVKYQWKMLASLPELQVICYFDATQYNNGHYMPCVLLLTSQLLFVVNIEDDTQQQALRLSEFDCHGPHADPTSLHITPVQKQLSSLPFKSSERGQDRIVEFVTKSTLYTTSSSVITIDSESHSDSTSQSSPESLNCCAACLKFYINPSLRNIFVSLFKTSNRNYMGKGFVF